MCEPSQRGCNSDRTLCWYVGAVRALCCTVQRVHKHCKINSVKLCARRMGALSPRFLTFKSRRRELYISLWRIIGAAIFRVSSSPAYVLHVKSVRCLTISGHWILHTQQVVTMYVLLEDISLHLARGTRTMLFLALSN